MSLEPFVTSRPLTLGVELELQIVNTHDYDLTTAAGDLMRLMKGRTIPGDVKPEITSSMLEIVWWDSSSSQAAAGRASNLQECAPCAAHASSRTSWNTPSSAEYQPEP